MEGWKDGRMEIGISKPGRIAKPFVRMVKWLQSGKDVISEPEKIAKPLLEFLES